MASQPSTSTPVCLIKNKNKQLLVNPEALKTLSEISQPVVVVAMVGMYRTGKSYLLNRLTGEQYGFPLGSTVQSEMKGIWMWCVPHPTKPNHTLVLLDTEGLGDVEKGDSDNDSWIFALAVLLSSTLIYNSMNTINSDALDKLHYVTELTNLIRVRSCQNPRKVKDSAEFVSFFPDFVWTVRDFTLDLNVDGCPITEDEYLENALKLIPGNNPRVESSNKTRECIKHFFPKRKCFTFDRPVHEKELLCHIEDLMENQLDPNFLQQLKSFCSFILSNAMTKTLGEEAKITGKRLGTLVTTYVEAISSGAVPCLDDAVTALAQRENSTAMQKAADYYREHLTQRVRLPTDNVQELLDLHKACKGEAISIFMQLSFKDEKQEFQKKLLEAIKNRKVEFLRQNEEASRRYCQKLIKQLSEPLMEKVSAGYFSFPGGSDLYKETKEKVVHDYKETPRKGVMANEVLQNFLRSQKLVIESIFYAEKELTAEQTLNEAVLRELQREKLDNKQTLKEYTEMHMDEHVEKLKREWKKERRAMMAELMYIRTCMKILKIIQRIDRLKIQLIMSHQQYKKLDSKLDDAYFFIKVFLKAFIFYFIFYLMVNLIYSFFS